MAQPLSATPARVVIAGGGVAALEALIALRELAGDTPTEAHASMHALWWPPTKIATRYLAPYLMGREDAAYLRSQPREAHAVERDLEILGRAR